MLAITWISPPFVFCSERENMKNNEIKRLMNLIDQEHRNN